MITKCTLPNNKDGVNYAVKSVAGPFEKESQSKKLSKAWSEPDTSDDDSYKFKSPIRSSPKKRKLMKCNRQLDNEFVDLPIPPTTQLSTRFIPNLGSIISETNSVLQGLNSSYIDTSKEDISTTSVSSPVPIYPTPTFNNSNCSSPIDDVEKNDCLSTGDANSPLCNTVKELQMLNSSSKSTPNENIKRSTARCASPLPTCSDSIEFPKETVLTGAQYNHILFSSNYTTNMALQETLVNNKEDDIDGIAELLYNSNDVCDFIVDNDQDNDVIQNFENSTTSNLTELSAVNINENCCCKNLLDIKSLVEKNEKSTKSILKQILIQLHMTNASNTKIVSAIKNMDQKIQVIMKSDSRMKSLALPIPTLPNAFLDLLPAKSIEEVDLIELILSDDSDGIKHQEELKTYIYMKVGSISSFSAAIRHGIDSCFKYEVLSNFSYKGKTKRCFINLKLFSIIYDALSGFRTDPQKEITFHNVTDNYIRHSGFITKNITSV